MSISKIYEMLGGASEADKRILRVHYSFVRALIHKLIEKKQLTETDAIEILDNADKYMKE